ncbi:MAG: retroviral-like aspartic protease family protein [Deltaproteobacteria bacterium]|nr:retroviral-like aspartic protease family protein [Deltaproteobacteria bacterium]
MSLAAGALAGCSPPRDNPLLSEGRIALETRLELPTYVDDSGRAFVVDTGTPRSLFRAAVLGVAGSSPPRAVERTADDWDVLANWGIRRAEVLAIPDEEFEAIVGPTGFDGIIGADLLRVGGVVTFHMSGNYLQFGRPAFLDDRIPIAEVESSLRGSGEICWDNDCFPYGPSRFVVDVELEGRPVAAMVDTGATLLTVMEDAIDSERPSTVEVTNAEGVFRTMSRLDALATGQLELVEPVVDLVPFSNRFVRLASQLGHPVDVLLGNSMLRELVVVLDYDHGRVELYPATEGADPELPDPVGVSFGLEPQDDGECYRVDRLKVDGEAMQAGLALGDCVRQVDQMLASERLTMAELLEPLLGPEVGYGFPVVVDDGDRGERTLLLHTERFVPPN